MRIRHSVVLLAFCCLASLPAHADGILLGTSVTSIGGIPVSTKAAVAQGFDLTQPVTITGIDVGIFSDTGANSDLFLFQLTDRIGPTVGSGDILASVLAPRVLFPTSPCGGICPSTELPLSPLNLNPGQYFLVGAEVSVKDPLASGAIWEVASAALTSAVGGVGPTFITGTSNPSDPASSNFAAGNQLVGFSLLGVANGEVPEPSSAILLASGLLAMAGISMRKRRLRTETGVYPRYGR